MFSFTAESIVLPVRDRPVAIVATPKIRERVRKRLKNIYTHFDGELKLVRGYRERCDTLIEEYSTCYFNQDTEQLSVKVAHRIANANSNYADVGMTKKFSDKISSGVKQACQILKDEGEKNFKSIQADGSFEALISQIKRDKKNLENDIAGLENISDQSLERLEKKWCEETKEILVRQKKWFNWGSSKMRQEVCNYKKNLPGKLELFEEELRIGALPIFVEKSTSYLYHGKGLSFFRGPVRDLRPVTSFATNAVSVKHEFFEPYFMKPADEDELAVISDEIFRRVVVLMPMMEKDKKDVVIGFVQSCVLSFKLGQTDEDSAKAVKKKLGKYIEAFSPEGELKDKSKRLMEDMCQELKAVMASNESSFPKEVKQKLQKYFGDSFSRLLEDEKEMKALHKNMKEFHEILIRFVRYCKLKNIEADADKRLNDAQGLLKEAADDTIEEYGKSRCCIL